jgi:hypothetical protein
VQLRGRYGDFIDWEVIEQAEIHFDTAWVAHNLVYPHEEPAHLLKAETAYNDVLEKMPKRSWFVPFAKRRLREEARAGLNRVRRAQTGDYDKDWLLV